MAKRKRVPSLRDVKRAASEGRRDPRNDATMGVLADMYPEYLRMRAIEELTVPHGDYEDRVLDLMAMSKVIREAVKAQAK